MKEFSLWYEIVLGGFYAILISDDFRGVHFRRFPFQGMDICSWLEAVNFP